MSDMENPNSYEFQREKAAREENLKSSGKFVDAQVALAGALGKVGLSFLAPVIKGILVITFLLPLIVAAIVAEIFNLLFKARAVGRIVQSALMGWLVGVSVTIALGLTANAVHDIIPTINLATYWTFSGIVGIAMALLAALWYCNSNYFMVKARDIWSVFSVNLAASLAVIYYPLFVLLFFSDKIPDLIVALTVPVSIFLAILLYVRSSSEKKVRKELDKIKGWVELPPDEFPEKYFIDLQGFQKHKLQYLPEEISKIESCLKEKHAPKSPIIALISLAIAFCLSLMFFNSLHNMITGYSKDEGEKQAVSGGSIAGKTLSVNRWSGYKEINLRSEASGTSKIIKKLVQEEEMTATGEISGLWLPVKSGDDTGFVFAPFLKLGKKAELAKRFPLAFEAVASAPIQAHYYETGYSVKPHTIPKGTVLTVLTLSSGYMKVEIKNKMSEVQSCDEAEKIVPKLNEDGSFITYPAEKPAEFPKEAPFEAIVTAAIGNSAPSTEKKVSIPAGAKVTVTGGLGNNGISLANVTYKGQDNIYIYWRYLKPAE